MVVTYFEIGRRIVNREQQGVKRVQYGKKVLQNLADYLTANIGKGWSIQNLRLMSQFYLVYSKSKIRQPPVSESEKQMDRTKIFISTKENFNEMDDIYWANASMAEKIETITFIRECFYGKEATNGRLQRFYKILKLK